MSTAAAGTPTAEQAAVNLYTDVRGTADAIERGDWLQARLGVTNVGMDIVGLGTDPLGAITSAGFGWIIQNISFLREPFDALLGDPNAIVTSAQGWAEASTQLSSAAQRYRTEAREGTTRWTGSAGDAYRSASAVQATNLEALAQVSNGISGALRGAGQALAQIRQAVLDIIDRACQRIIQIIIEALAASWASFGASIAKGILQSVQTAVQAAQQAVQKIQKLITTLQRIIQLVERVVRLAETVRQVLESIGQRASGRTTGQTAPSGTRLAYRGDLADGTAPAGNAGTATLSPVDPGAGYRYDGYTPATTGPVSQNGWPADPPRRARQVPGTNVRVVVADGPAGDVLVHVLAQVHRRVESLDLRSPQGEADDWGYSHRPVRGGAELSNHASATAVDVNATRHSLGERSTFTQAQVDEIHRILHEVDDVVRWGGDYPRRADEMHFEINATPEAVRAVADRLRRSTPDP